MCVAVGSEPGYSLSRRAVHPRLTSVHQGHRELRGQEVNPVQHGSSGPKQRDGHGSEPNLTTGKDNEMEGGITPLINFLLSRCLSCIRKLFDSFHKSFIFVYLCKSFTGINLSSLVVCNKCHSVPGSLSIAVIDVFHNGFVLKKLLEVPLEVWSNPTDQLRTYRGIIKHPHPHARVFGSDLTP